MSISKRLIALLVAVSALVLVFPVGAAEGGRDDRGTHTNLILDTDPEGGYEGDYVVIYNPTYGTEYAGSTGSLNGKIETEVDPGNSFVPVSDAFTADPVRPGKIDVHDELRLLEPQGPAPLPEKGNWQVGDTKDFNIQYYSPAGYAGAVRFKLLYIGAHCRVWTPVKQSYCPLDGIDASYAATAANEFDGKFDLMRSSFGDFYDPSGDGKVNMLFYNIDDGWEPGYSYIAGYFWAGDYYYNSLPAIHIDTYPGVLYTNEYGESTADISSCYGTLVHEFQHMINYSTTQNGMHTWLDECFSGAAEELCYPGSGLFTRIQSWQGFYYQSYSQLVNPVKEVAYDPNIWLHRGGPLPYWNDSDDDILSRYAAVMFFSQYLIASCGGSSVFKRISENCRSDSVADSLDALTAGTGMTLEQIWRGYAISMIANDYGSGYGFAMNPGYDPDEYYGIQNLYDLLPAVIYTSTKAASINGGGFITVKPKNGVFVPPATASDKLRYAGISFADYIPGDVNGDGTVDTEDALLALRCALGLITLDPDEFRRADIDRNGVIDTEDALRILRAALGIH